MILCFKLYSMLAKYKILELGKHLSFILFPILYPEFHRSLLECRLIHPYLEIVFKFGCIPARAHVCVSVHTDAQTCIFLGRKETFHQLLKEAKCTKKSMTIGLTTSFDGLVNVHIHSLGDFHKNIVSYWLLWIQRCATQIPLL